MQLIRAHLLGAAGGDDVVMLSPMAIIMLATIPANRVVTCSTGSQVNTGDKSRCRVHLADGQVLVLKETPANLLAKIESVK